VITALLLALATSSPVVPAKDLATYEDERLAAVLLAEGLRPFHPSATHRIAFVRLVGHDVFTADDPWPDVLNLAHVTTKEDVVARELLFAPGDAFIGLEETARNLRDMFIFSLVRVVPVTRIDDGSHGVLVFVRDLWSLRFEQGFQVTGASIDRLKLQLTERNVAGRAKALSVRFGLDPSAWSIGESYVDRRVWGGALTASERLDVLFSTNSGALDGSLGGVFVGAPLISFEQPWGFDVAGAYDMRVVRQLQGSQVLTYDDPGTAAVEAVPRVWSQRSFDAEASVRRQFGAGTASAIVHRLSLGVGVSDDFVEPNAETALPAAIAESFTADVLPSVRRTLFPFVAYHGFSARHRVYEDLDTFGQSEAVRLGPSLSVGMGAGAKAALSSSDTMFASGGLGVALDVYDGLFEAAFEAAARYEDGVVVNRVLSARLRMASAPVVLGRFFARGDATFRQNDVTHALVSLGGDNGLRGYPSQAFFDFGASTALGTLEWRSLPLAWQSIHLGFAAFYDVGSVFSAPNEMIPHHSLGVGVRFLFPQFNRGVYRVDFAAPLDAPGFRVLFSLGDTQTVEHAQPAFVRLAPRR
jgi:hypothetical protein